MNAGNLLFLVCSALALAGALIVVLSKNPIRGAMGLFTTIIGISGLFLRLSAQFLWAMQVLVYAGAVVILFVFVVMLLGANAHVKEDSTAGSKISRVVGGALLGALGLGAFSLFAGMDWHQFQTISPAYGSVEAVGTQLFTEALVPFELTTVLLMVAVVGALAVARSKPQLKVKEHVENPTLRMYHGPLMDRDAEHPLDGKTLRERVLAAEQLASGKKESA